jgi:two-component system sensor histidine kinase RpfC
MACDAVAVPGEVATLGLRVADLDLIVLADHLRRLDLAAVRAEVNTALGGGPPCLFLTCAARRPDGQGAGVGYLGKPFLAEDLTAAAERLLGLAPEAEAAAPAAAGLTAGASGAIRVLVAEDNEIAAKVLTTFLKKMGYPHVRVADGEEALREALAGGYGIAVMDLRMPKLDGAEFARRYRAEAPGRPLPIVALTANASEDVKQACLEAGMDAFLTKPVSPELLRQTIETLGLRG